MKNVPITLLPLPAALLAFLLVFNSCRKDPAASADTTFLERMNAAHDGDYFATYPLSNPNSCIAQVKAEVPVSLQPFACLSIWYHLPQASPEPEQYLRFLDLWEKNYPLDSVRAFVQLTRAEVLIDLAKFDSARTCLSAAYDLYYRLNRPLDASDATYLKARSYLYQNNFAEALRCDFEVLDLLDAHDTAFSQRHYYVYGNIAIAYGRSGDKPQYLFWLKKNWSADYSKFENPRAYKTKAAHNLSVFYLDDHPDSSLIWAKTALEMKDKEEKAWPPEGRLFHFLARALLKKGDCGAALPYFSKAYRQNEAEKSNLFAFYQYSAGLGDCYLCLGKLDSAEFYLRESLASPDTGALAQTHQSLSNLQARRGEWKTALAAEKESRRLSEIHLTAEKAKAVAEVETRYETAQKERRIAELQAQQKAARLQMLIIALSLLLLAGLALSLFFRQRSRRLILEQDYLLLEQEKELAHAYGLLKAQESEHFQADLKITQEELGNTARLLALKNQLVENLQMRLDRQLHTATDSGAPATANSQLYSLKILTRWDWVEFQKQFEQAFPNYLFRLKQRFPSLTNAEIRLFLLMKLDFKRKEMAETLGISEDSVLRSRRRLGNKLGTPNARYLNEFIRTFE